MWREIMVKTVNDMENMTIAMRRGKEWKKTNEKMIKGYKGFSPGMICRGKQYSENATFEEEYAKPCVCGIHFCQYPLDVFNFYSPADEAGLNEFAEVEPLSPVLTDDNIKFCSKKLYIKKRISLATLCQAAVNFILADKINEDQKSENHSAATNTAEVSAHAQALYAEQQVKYFEALLNAGEVGK